MDAGRALERQGQRQRIFGIGPADTVPPAGHRQLPPRQDKARALGRKGKGCVALRDLARFALDGIAQYLDRVAMGARQIGGSGQRLRGRGINHVFHPRQPRIIGQHRIAARRQIGKDRGRWLYPPARQGRKRARRIAAMADGGARGDIARIIARHIGNHQREHVRRIGGGGQPPALYRRNFLADGVHHANGRARGQ